MNSSVLTRDIAWPAISAATSRGSQCARTRSRLARMYRCPPSGRSSSVAVSHSPRRPKKAALAARLRMKRGTPRARTRSTTSAPTTANAATATPTRQSSNNNTTMTPAVMSRLATSSISRSDSRRPSFATSPSMRSSRVPGDERPKKECPRSTVWRNSVRRRLFIACQASTVPAWDRTISSADPARATQMNSTATRNRRSSAAPACAKSRNACTTRGLATCTPAPATSAATTTMNMPRRPRVWARTRAR